MKWPFGLFPSRRPYWKNLDFDENEIRYLDERIAWNSVQKATAGLRDNFITDSIWIELSYPGDILVLWEEWPRFWEFIEMMKEVLGVDDEPIGYLMCHPFSNDEFVLFDHAAVATDAPIEG